MPLTRAQRKVLEAFVACGGAAWCGSGIENGVFTGYGSHLSAMVRLLSVRDYEAYRKRLKRHGITSTGVWCSSVVFGGLLRGGFIQHVPGVPGASQLTPAGRLAVKS